MRGSAQPGQDRRIRVSGGIPRRFNSAMAMSLVGLVRCKSGTHERVSSHAADFSQPGNAQGDDMQITKDGEYTTRSGLPVRIYATDGGTSHDVVHGAYCSDGVWMHSSWGKNGRVYTGDCPHGLDLIHKPKVRKLDCWLNVYLIDGMVRIGADYSSKDNADAAHGAHERMACIHIQRDVAEGEGLGDA